MSSAASDVYKRQALVDHMGEQFPELVKKQVDLKEILDEEEEAFARTLDRGEAQFEKYAAKAAKDNGKKLDGDIVWRLYDTFGFPVDLTKLMAEERGLDIDEEEVNVAKEKAREASKAVKESVETCLLYTSPSPRDLVPSRMPSSA